MMGTHFPNRAKRLDQGHDCGPGQEGEDLIFENATDSTRTHDARDHEEFSNS
jgi:hypothetical protein